MANLETMAELRNLVAKACKANGCHTLAHDVSIRWNRRLTACAGRAWDSAKQIELSTKLWQCSTLAEREQTVVHETCHLIASYKHGLAVKAHGWEWQSCMIRAGKAPKRCHNIDRSALVQLYSYSCACRTHKLSKTRHYRAMKGKPYFCKFCKTQLKKA